MSASERLPKSFETSRLVLREPRPEDALAIFQSYSQDPLVTRYLVWKPNGSLAETEAFIAASMQARANGDRYPYVVALKDAEHIPLGMFDAKINQHIVDIGYVLARAHWGNGYMPEAVRFFTEAALALPPYYRVQAYCDVENGPSARTLEKAGFLREARVERHTLHPNISPEPRACYLYARRK
jgi:ribosomal-protein-alanine N-acetyltransferase